MNITPTAIAGLGMTQLGKVYGRTPAEFAVEAVTRAAADAGLALADIDGLLVNPGVNNDTDLRLQSTLQLRDLRLLTTIQGFGSSAIQMVQYAPWRFLPAWRTWSPASTPMRR